MDRKSWRFWYGIGNGNSHPSQDLTHGFILIFSLYFTCFSLCSIWVWFLKQDWVGSYTIRMAKGHYRHHHFPRRIQIYSVSQFLFFTCFKFIFQGGSIPWTLRTLDSTGACRISSSTGAGLEESENTLIVIKSRALHFAHRAM
jgi:hypothetical protein